MTLVSEMVLLCGGKGERLGTLTEQIPKPLLPVGGEPFLQRLLFQWRKEGIKRFVLSIGYLPHLFRPFIEKNSHLGEFTVVEEPEPLGTGGGLRYAVEKGIQSEMFYVANGDSYVTQELSELFEFHKKGNYRFILTAVSAARVLGGAKQKGRLRIGQGEVLEGFTTESNIQEGWINGGIYLTSRKEILQWPQSRYDLEKHILPDVRRYSAHVFKSKGKLLDIGIPECYTRFDRELGPLDHLFSAVQDQ